MLSASSGVVVGAAALVLFAVVAVGGARRLGIADRDAYLSARSSQDALSLALSFFASALGAWILFAPPEVGAVGLGFLGIFGYAIGQALAVAVFAVVGPAVRERVPRGTTILDFVRLRFGRVMQGSTGAISVFYMFIFLTAELTAIGGVVFLLSGLDPWIPVVAVAAVTAAYTAYGGLPASIATDRWQAWLVVALVGVGVGAVVVDVDDPIGRAADAGIGSFTRPGAETLVVLVVAIVAANLFHQGFWQRVWAARDRRTLAAGTVGGGLLILPLVFATGLAGMVAAGGEELEAPSLAFFALLDGLPEAVLLVVLALGITLVASTADTLQNALTSLVAVHVAGGRVGLGTARWVTLALTVPAAVVAVQGYSVLRLFLIADLLAAAIAVPVFSGLWRRARAEAAVAGSAAGLLAVVVLGWVTEGGLLDGLRLLTLPNAPPLPLGPFLVAPLASAAVTVLVSLARPRVPRS